MTTEEAVRKENIDRWQAPPEPNKKRLGVFLLVWLCLTLFQAYVFGFAWLLCDLFIHPRSRSDLCTYVYIPNWATQILKELTVWQWPLEAFLLLSLPFLASLILFPMMMTYWMYAIAKALISKKRNV